MENCSLRSIYSAIAIISMYISVAPIQLSQSRDIRSMFHDVYVEPLCFIHSEQPSGVAGAAGNAASGKGESEDVNSNQYVVFRD